VSQEVIKPEYWVMRVCRALRTNEPIVFSQCDAATQITVNALAYLGKLCIMPDGTVTEPIEVFDVEADAQAHRLFCRRRWPREDFRVVINADVGAGVNRGPS
jgi:hypothetical protein